ncbi:MAG TPA: hypothetical protein VJ583_06405 [Nitrososphaeraceae archaeon]|nr:hypothetical protein [Nitrososphaeraceae archaeon]
MTLPSLYQYLLELLLFYDISNWIFTFYLYIFIVYIILIFSLLIPGISATIFTSLSVEETSTNGSLSAEESDGCCFDINFGSRYTIISSIHEKIT